ncbi:serpin B6-like [Uranotaenia lowii]|uniref:serpin B6-like n=1 Tax=Uranotaenia lowii TaxID=190385 RepID=UPI0024786ED5|nr:serpin B6-like [Uranotaenia lowii]
MKFGVKILVLVLVGTVGSVLTQEPNGGPPHPDSFGAPDFSFGDGDFTINYFKALYSPEINTAVSPIALRLPMAVFYEAAGSSLDHVVQKSFYLPDSKLETTNNAIKFVQEIHENKYLTMSYKLLKDKRPFSEHFNSSVAKVLGLVPEEVSFSRSSPIVKSVNAWASFISKGKIADFFLDQLPSNVTEMFLGNTVTLEARWAEMFPLANTDQRKFNYRTGPRDTAMMRESIEVLHSSVENYQAIQIPFSEDSDLAMWILLPGEGKTIRNLVENLSSEMLYEIETTAMPKLVDITLPRFEIQSLHRMEDVLTRMGHGELFELQDFEIFQGRKSMLPDLRQHSYLKINEDGTGVPDSMASTIYRRSDNIAFNADEPFVFIIKKITSDVIVFIGHYSN